jgi:N-acetylglucosaminyl-diphospho-decaprenol L-rhamnosyltransferase
VNASAPALAVIVVAHDSGPLLADCIRRVLEQDLPLEVVLVDNASRDGSVDVLPVHPALTVLRNADNRGFGAACNQGVRAAVAPRLLFLNPDCLLPDPAAARRLVAALDAAPAVGLLGAQLLEGDCRPQPASRRRLPTLAGLLVRGDAHVGDGPGVEYVQATSGALMLMPRELFVALDGFDEGYVLHCEDLDLCRRVRGAGRQVAVLPTLAVTHLKGRSSRRRPFWVEWQKHRGMLRYLRKFELRGGARLLLPLAFAAVWMRWPFAGLRAWWRARG